jgi:hypothetical protein
MAIHTFHPDTHAHGLADGCPRCNEHAAHPLSSLDEVNLTMLRIRIEEGLQARSENEAKAMDALSRGQGL